jgi:hypothetical protein
MQISFLGSLRAEQRRTLVTAVRYREVGVSGRHLPRRPGCRNRAMPVHLPIVAQRGTYAIRHTG